MKSITFRLSAIKIHFDVLIQAFSVITEEKLDKFSLLTDVMVNKFIIKTYIIQKLYVKIQLSLLLNMTVSLLYFVSKFLPLLTI